MKLRSMLVWSLVGLNVCGCASMKGSLATGVVTGAAIGAGSGAGFASEDRGGAALKGALIGGVVGLVSSYFIHGALENRDADVRRETLLNLERFGVEGIPSQPMMYPEPLDFGGASPRAVQPQNKTRTR